MIVEPFAAFAPLPASITSTVEVFTPNGAFTDTTGRSPAPPVTVTPSNLSVDALAGPAIASGVAQTATSARSTRRRRTKRSLLGEERTTVPAGLTPSDAGNLTQRRARAPRACI